MTPKTMVRAVAVAVALNLVATTTFALEECKPIPPPCCERPVAVAVVLPPAPPPAAPSLPVPAAPPVVMAPAQPGVPPRDEYCHYEPSTELWEIRRTYDLTRMISLTGNEQTAASHVCDQHVVETVALPVAPVPVAMPVQAPAPIVEAQPTIEVPAPAMPAEAAAESEEETARPIVPVQIPPIVPAGLPVAGGDDGCSYYDTCEP
jgi:hypothetical protein